MKSLKSKWQQNIYYSIPETYWDYIYIYDPCPNNFTNEYSLAVSILPKMPNAAINDSRFAINPIQCQCGAFSGGTQPEARGISADHKVHLFPLGTMPGTIYSQSDTGSCSHISSMVCIHTLFGATRR
jgi:hypothetical protein